MNMVQKVVEILVKVGLSHAVSNKVAASIDNLYKEAEQQKLQEARVKGGKAKVLKGTAKIKATDPERFERIMAARRKKS